MRQLQLYIKEIRGLVYVIGVAPGKDLYVLSSRANVQEAVCHALAYARLLGVPEREVYVGGHSIPQLATLGAEFVMSSIHNEGEDCHC